jgi:hypothetical protein
MKRIPQLICATALLAIGAAGPAFGQPTQTPAPAQAGDDPSMAQPKGSTQPVLQAAPPVENPESTVGLAPAEQPVNNIKRRVAGEVVPSSQETAAHNSSIFEHDKQPILTHTFNFTAEQKQAIVEALAQEKGVSAGNDMDLQETMVVPAGIALKPVPERIAQEMPWVKPYFYVKTGDRIVLVNPLGKYVAAVIE